MPANKHHQELDDVKQKLQNAKEAAKAPDAGEREKADLKLLEQEAAAQKLKAGRPPTKHKAESEAEAKLDKALRDSFPGSDPVSFVEAAPMKKRDRKASEAAHEERNSKTRH
jgi:hypothetical protein